MNDFELKTDNLRKKIREYKNRSELTYKVIASRMGIPYTSFRNFMCGSVTIGQSRYDNMTAAIDKMLTNLPW